VRCAQKKYDFLVQGGFAQEGGLRMPERKVSDGSNACEGVRYAESFPG